MATIGSFQKTDAGYTGVIKTATLALKARYMPVDRPSDKGPDFRVFTGTGSAAVEIGAAWKRTARDTGMAYLSTKLDDPAFAAPIFASLVEDTGNANAFSLIWSRAKD